MTEEKLIKIFEDDLIRANNLLYTYKIITYSQYTCNSSKIKHEINALREK